MLVDLDAQADASYSTNLKYDPKETTFELLLQDIDIKDAIVHADMPDAKGSLDLVPASPNLATLDVQIARKQLIDTQYNLMML